MGEKHQKIRIKGQTLTLFADRAMLWNEKKTLLVADLHWGKSEVFQSQGLSLPSAVLDADLSRLSDKLLTTGAERLIILGDLIHAKSGLTPRVIQTVAEWRRGFEGRIIVIKGNHDKINVLPKDWNMELSVGSFYDKPFVFSHFPEADRGGFVWSGHIHPVVWLKGGGDALRLPCFYLDKDVGILPAFGTATGGGEVSLAPGSQIFAIAGDTVLNLDR